jgi:hypothetical protein
MPGEANTAAQRQGSPAKPEALSEVSASERAQVAQLIANGKTAVAVDVAKQIHKRHASASSEAVLVEAYAARIRALAKQHLLSEARSVLELVSARYPASRGRLRTLPALLAAHQGSLAALLECLTDPDLLPEQRAEIDEYIRREVVDLRQIAACEALAADHPLRAGAGVLISAFEAATSGPVGDLEPELAGISRRSPLAPWKLLVRAIVAFYRGEEESCRKALEAIEPDAAAARLVPALRAMLGDKVALSPAAANLVAQVTDPAESFRKTLCHLDRAFDKEDQSRSLMLIREAVSLCRRYRPELLERLRQHISIRSVIAGFTPEAVATAMEGPSLKSAHFWRLLARAMEEIGTDAMGSLQACAAWEEFRKHAIREGWLPPKGPEIAALYLHMAEVLLRIDEEDLEVCREQFLKRFDGFRLYYRGQPPEIRALAEPPGWPEPYFVSPHALLERACEADPRADHFRLWLEWTRRNLPHMAESVAWSWRIARQEDAEPLLFLMEEAESRNALQRAFKYMQMAEALDGLHPEVRRARFRLLVSMALRHLRQKKPRLADREIRALESLPQAQQGDRPAFVAALRWVSSGIAGAADEAAAAASAAIERLGSETAAHVMLATVARAAKYSGELPRHDGKSRREPVAEALGRACLLGEDVGLPVELSAELSERLAEELSAGAAWPSPQALLAVGEAALRVNDRPLAYALASEGLGQDAAMQAAALFLRARSLPPWEAERSEACLNCAAELARRRRDLDLLGRIAALRKRAEWLEAPEAGELSLTSEEIRAVLKRESQLRSYPDIPPEELEPAECNCPICRARRGRPVDPLEKMLAEMIEAVGPEAAAAAFQEAFGFAGRPRRKRRRRPAPDEFSF